MADEYIRREDALKGQRTGTFANGICFVAEPCVTVEYIESLEPADVVPVVHGKWIGYDDTERFTAQCGLCGNVIDTRFGSNFCPNCGAKMDVR